MTKVRPRGKYILVKPDDEKVKEASHGIIMPTNHQEEKKSFGTVESVGNEITDITIGDRVIYSAYGGESFKIFDGKKEVDFLLVHDEDIIAFIK